MNAFHRVLLTGLAGLAVSLASNVMAQSPAAEFTQAEVRKIDKDNRKLTLKHGEIKSLDMPPMTMVFQVADPAMLDKLSPGDRVRFRAVHEAGKYTVTEIEPLR